MIRFDSGNSWFKHPFGAVKCDSEVIFRIEAEGNPFAVNFVANGEKIPMKYEGDNFYVCTYHAPKHGCLVFYHFEIEYEFTMVFGKGEGFCGLENSDREFQLTVYEGGYAPKWVFGAVCYQIFPDRFCKAEPHFFKDGAYFYEDWEDLPQYRRTSGGSISEWDFFGGNFKGIESKLPYLEELGVNLIYLNPVFSARSNHRYDTEDYMRVDCVLGSEADFKSLVDSAKARGIRIILDGVFNHTGCDSVYFDINNTHGGGAYCCKTSKYRQWYNIHDDKTYDCWWGITDLPSVNELEPSYIDFIVKGEASVIKRWFSVGIDGWRLDVADELPDEFLKLFRDECRKINPESYVVGEVWEDASNKEAYGKLREYLTTPELDGVTNYPFGNGVISFLKGELSSHALARELLTLAENYPCENMLASLSVLGTHDSPRILSRLGGDVSLLKQAAALQMVAPGVPCIYYGDEAGLLGGDDPDNRRTYPWGKENRELVEWYKKIIGIRKNHPLLAMGRAWFGGVRDDVFYIKRFWENKLFYVFVNRGGNSVSTEWKETLFNLETGEKTNGFITIAPHGIAFFKN